MARQPLAAVLGPLPPPLHGHMVVTMRVLGAARLRRDFELVHVDLSDHRPLSTLNRIDVKNIWLAVVHAVRLARTVAVRRPSLVYLPLAQNRLAVARDMVLLSIALLGRTRVVAHVHGGGFASFLRTQPEWFGRPVRALLRRCAALVAMSESQQAELAATLPGVEVSLVRHGTVSTAATEHRLDAERLRALYVSSNLIETKGLFVLLDAVAEAERRGLPIDWTLVGSWSIEADRERAQALIEGLTTVTVRGPLEPAELKVEYEAADVFVFPTTQIEGFALVRIEAMAAGLPVVTTEAGGGREMIRDGSEGFVVDYDAPGALLDRLVELHEDPTSRLEMGKAARDRQRALFSEEAFGDAMAAAWTKALERR